MRTAWRWTLLVAAVLGLVPSPLRAEGTPQEQPRKIQNEESVVGKARALRERADAHDDAGRHAEAIQNYESAIQLLRALGSDHAELALSLKQPGLCA